MKKGTIGFVVVLMVLISSNVLANKPLTFEERVKAQEAIEKVYYSHRIWPKENPQPKPLFEKMVTKEQIEAKVNDYLKKCAALDQFWQRPIIASQLQAEMDRMAKGTKDPQTLNELFAALNNDPYLIAECLARPVLADRLIHNWYANDERFHKEAREKAEEAAKILTPENFCAYPEGRYGKVRYRLGSKDEEEQLEHEGRAVYLNEKEFSAMVSQIPDDAKISKANENNDSFTITHTILKNESEIEIESLTFVKKSLDEWLRAEDLPVRLPETGSGISMYLPPLPEGTCAEGWDNGILDDDIEPRQDPTAVWTGTEMIVWGGVSVNTGGRYRPSTDTWMTTSTGTNCPSARSKHTAVWTGTEMIVWGGSMVTTLNSGGRYDPETDSWSAMPTAIMCESHTAVWTGTEMIIWGGYNYSGGTYLQSGGRYNPSTGLWTFTSTGTGCPSKRGFHTAVWTDNEMIVWGGYNGSSYFQTGGKYNPSTDTWTATSTGTSCPEARAYHTAVWTGSEMIIWGGVGDSTYKSGGRYNPADDTWTATSTGTNCPLFRYYHTAIWTGTDMIIWGGHFGTSLQTGGCYKTATDTWTATSTGTNCPSAREYHTAVWTGSEMIVWGGIGTSTNITNTGGRYNPETDSWIPTYLVPNSPSARYNHTSVWTGSEMIIWGGSNGTGPLSTGGRYAPSTDHWTTISSGANCPSARRYHTAVWTGSEMIVWGGDGGSPSYKNDGGRYEPAADLWALTSTGAGCPSARSNHSAVWTGHEMIIWGGINSSCLNTGGKYDPSANTWVSTSTGSNVPAVRNLHTAIWTGSEMIVWGGRNNYLFPWYKNDGGRYNPSTDTWTATSTGANCPSRRIGHTAVWTGGEMVVWGGTDGSSFFNNGGRYDPVSDIWLGTSTGTGCPSTRYNHAAVWTGSEMIIWGGGSYTGGRYDPVNDNWTATSTGSNCPAGRSLHTALWTGSSMIVWGGESSGNVSATGGIYFIPSIPSALSENTAADIGGCSDSGVLVSWTAPSNWGDGSSGTRTFDILRDSTPIASGLSEATLSYVDSTGDNGTSYLYQVRANNGCGLSTTTAGVSASDNVGTVLDEVPSFDNMYSWDPVSGAGGYRLYRGTRADLPNLKTSTADGCLRYEGTATSYDLSGDDPSEATGGLYWYLVTAYTGACEGTAGEGTGFTRVLSSSGACQ